MDKCARIRHCGKKFETCKNCKQRYCDYHLNQPHHAEFDDDEDGIMLQQHCMKQEPAGTLRAPTIDGVENGCATFTWPSGVVVSACESLRES